MSGHPFIDPALAHRHRKASIYRWYARGAIIFTLSFLIYFLVDIVSTAMPVFMQTYIQVEVNYSERAQRFPSFAVDRDVRKLVSHAWLRGIPHQLEQNPRLLGSKDLHWVLANDEVDQYVKRHHYNLSDSEIAVVESLRQQGRLEKRWNRRFFTSGDSKVPENAGVLSALVGSVLTMMVTMVLAFPIGVMTAVYLEEFSVENRWTRLIEVNINNLAGIPSILFGLLGLSVFINLFGLPRSSPLVGGLTLALMTLPIIIVSSRSALRSVPVSIRQAGYGLGLTRLQIVQDHVLPIAMPGILTGSIIGLAHAMGETAPLIIVGMIAFIPDAPGSITEAATVLPAQIFTWAGMPERAYVEKTAGGILVILAIILSLNSAAIYLRKRYEIKW